MSAEKEKGCLFKINHEISTDVIECRECVFVAVFPLESLIYYFVKGVVQQKKHLNKYMNIST